MRKNIVLIIIAVLVAAGCIKLGFWQLSRLKERRAANAATHYERVVLHGVYDYAHQIIVMNRSRNGSPGIHILTPLRVAGSDTAILVNRGWIYSPDGKTADLKPWQETDTLNGEGYIQKIPPQTVGTAPYPITPYQVVLMGSTEGAKNVPPRIGIPVLSEGNHLSYAIQWFSFAAIALVGTFIFIRKTPHF